MNVWIKERLGKLFDLTSLAVSNRSKALVIPSRLSGASPHSLVQGGPGLPDEASWSPKRQGEVGRYNGSQRSKNLGWKSGGEIWQNCFWSLEHESYQ